MNSKARSDKMLEVEEGDPRRRVPGRLNPDGNERLTAAVGLLLLVPIAHGPPVLAMRLLAPLFVAATIVLFGSGVAMGILHGHALVVARRLHGPASVVWLVLLGLHVLAYIKRSLLETTDEVRASSGDSVRGARARAYVLAATLAAGLVVAAATVPAQHHWVDLRRDHRATVLRGAGGFRGARMEIRDAPGVEVLPGLRQLLRFVEPRIGAADHFLARREAVREQGLQ